VQKFHEITDKDSPVQMILGSTVAIILLPRDAMRKHGPCCRAMSVRLSAWVSDILELQVAAFKRLCILSKRINISSKILHSRLVTILVFRTKFHGNIATMIPELEQHLQCSTFEYDFI